MDPFHKVLANLPFFQEIYRIFDEYPQPPGLNLGSSHLVQDGQIGACGTEILEQEYFITVLLG